MILEPGTWMGRGSYRPTDETMGTNFEATLVIQEDDQGMLIDTAITVQSGQQLEWGIWIVPDEYGTYSITARGTALNASGIGKMESVPHVGMLWTEGGEACIAFAIFALRDSHGIRGFGREPGSTLTWELALQPQHQAVTGGNDVSFAPRRRR